MSFQYFGLYCIKIITSILLDIFAKGAKTGSAREGSEWIIASAVAKGDRVQITGFGTFERRKRKKRTGRNPQTGATINIPAAKYPAFLAGKSLKDRVQK